MAPRDSNGWPTVRILTIVSNDVLHDTRVLKEARALQAAGHEVVAIGWDRSGRLPAYEEWRGVPIHRIQTRGLLRLLAKDVFRNPLWWSRAYRLARKLAFDVVHCHDLDTLSTGVRLKRATGKPLVYDSHEVFPYMIEEDLPKVVVNAAFRMERRLAPQADHTIAVNDAVKSYLDEVSGRPAVVVRNCSELLVDAYQPPPASPFTMVYVGTLHSSRFLVPAVEVVSEISNVRLVLAGSKQLASVLQSLCAQHPNTQFLGLVPNDRVLPMTLEAHAVLCMFDPSHRINQVGLPNKVFEAMATGRPVIVTAGLSMAKLVEQEECGLAVPYTKAGLRNALERLRDDPALAERLGRNGLAAAQREYNWAAEQRKLATLYQQIEEDLRRRRSP